jgi:hypothetical protein
VTVVVSVVPVVELIPGLVVDVEEDVVFIGVLVMADDVGELVVVDVGTVGDEIDVEVLVVEPGVPLLHEEANIRTKETTKKTREHFLI